MIHVVAALTAAPGKRDALLAAFHELIPTVRAEQGCIEYDTAIDAVTDIAAQAPPRDDVVMVVEKWESIDALKAHLAIDHMVKFREATADLVTGISLQIFEPA